MFSLQTVCFVSNVGSGAYGGHIYFTCMFAMLLLYRLIQYKLTLVTLLYLCLCVKIVNRQVAEVPGWLIVHLMQLLWLNSCTHLRVKVELFLRCSVNFWLKLKFFFVSTSDHPTWVLDMSWKFLRHHNVLQSFIGLTSKCIKGLLLSFSSFQFHHFQH